MIATMLMVLSAVAGEAHAYALQAGAPVWDVAIDDVNGDGLKDIYALCCVEDSDPLQKTVALFLAEADGGYTPEPSICIGLEPAAGGLFLAETDGKAPKELVAIDSRGATIHGYADGAFHVVAQPRFMSLIPSGAREPMFLKSAAQDLDGDGIDEWLIPVPAGYQIRTPQDLLADVPCDVVSEIQRTPVLRIYHRLPAIQEFTLAGEKDKGVAFLSDSYADFAYGAGWKERKRFKVPGKVDEKWEATASMSDINGDNFPDLVVSQLKGAINIEMLTQIYIASGPFEYPPSPTVSFGSKGAIASPFIQDVNQDGHSDLVFVKVPIGVSTFVNYFLFKKLNMQVEAHLFDGQGYKAKPDFTQTLSLNAPDGREKIAYAMGDFNGDGLKDVLLSSGPDQLVVYSGSKDAFVSEKPWLSVAAPSFGTAQASDLNGDGRDDIVLYHPGISNKTRIEVVAF